MANHTPASTVAAVGGLLREVGALAVTPEGRLVMADQLATTVKRSRLGRILWQKLQLMYEYLCDPQEDLGPKLLVGAALLYLLLPNRLIPKWTTLIGLTDNVAAVIIVVTRVQDILTRYEERRASRMAMMMELRG